MWSTKTLAEHEVLDLGAKMEIVLQGLRYAVMFQDLDTLRKCVIDLQNCSQDMDNMLEAEFGR